MRSLAFDVGHLGLCHVAHALLNGLHNGVVVDFTTVPFQLEILAFIISRQLNPPEGLRNEFLDFFCLIDAEAKRGSLAGPVGDSDLLS